MSENFVMPSLIYLIYSDSKYAKQFYIDESLENNTNLIASIEKVIGEPIIIEWDAKDKKSVKICDAISGKEDLKFDAMLINLHDMDMLQYIYYKGCKLDKLYIITDELKIERISSLKVTIEVG